MQGEGAGWGGPLFCHSSSIPGGPVLLPQLAGPPQYSVVNTGPLYTEVGVGPGSGGLGPGGRFCWPSSCVSPSVVPSRPPLPSPWGYLFPLLQLRKLGPREGQ